MSMVSTDVVLMAVDAIPAFERTLDHLPVRPADAEPLHAFELLSRLGPDHVLLVGTDEEVLDFAARLIRAVADRKILATLDADAARKDVR
jgi:hypothetical protein